MAAKHAISPFHLLLLGGDQLYSDSMWEELDVLSKWAALPTKEGVKQAASDTLKRQIADFFRGLYPNRWSQAAVAKALATIPTLMMWDDHDIMDGWGSYPSELHTCDVYQAIFASARETFSLYQLQNAAGESHP
jgi:phosphodiesterase/alkaline phosphatase D-like protein